MMTIIRHAKTESGFALVGSYSDYGKFTVSFQIYNDNFDGDLTVMDKEYIYNDERPAVEKFEAYLESLKDFSDEMIKAHNINTGS